MERKGSFCRGVKRGEDGALLLHELEESGGEGFAAVVSGRFTAAVKKIPEGVVAAPGFVRTLASFRWDAAEESCSGYCP